MYRLSASVGKNGVNRHDDVFIVQKLLNKNSHLINTVGRLTEDGNLDERTARAIIVFQRDVVRFATPDGRVDPNGRTFRVLVGDSPHGATVAFIQLPTVGDGYYIYSDLDKTWGTPRTINSVKKLGAALKSYGSEIGIGHISFSSGARMPPHKSHRRGVDVDIRPIRKDDKRSPVTIYAAEYDRDETRKLVEVLRKDDNLKLILFNDRRIDGVRYWEGHDNHLHVRFKE